MGVLSCSRTTSGSPALGGARSDSSPGPQACWPGMTQATAPWLDSPQGPRWQEHLRLTPDKCSGPGPSILDHGRLLFSQDRLLSRSRSGMAPAPFTEGHDPGASEKPVPAACVPEPRPRASGSKTCDLEAPHPPNVGLLWEPSVTLEGGPRAHAHQHLLTCRTEAHVWLQQATSNRAASGPDSG